MREGGSWFVGPEPYLKLRGYRMTTEQLAVRGEPSQKKQSPIVRDRSVGKRRAGIGTVIAVLGLLAVGGGGLFFMTQEIAKDRRRPPPVQRPMRQKRSPGFR